MIVTVSYHYIMQIICKLVGDFLLGGRSVYCNVVNGCIHLIPGNCSNIVQLKIGGKCHHILPQVGPDAEHDLQLNLPLYDY